MVPKVERCTLESRVPITANVQANTRKTLGSLLVEGGDTSILFKPSSNSGFYHVMHQTSVKWLNI